MENIIGSIWMVAVLLLLGLWWLCWLAVPFKVYAMAKDIRAIREGRALR